jgi:hypothetical protein
MIATAATVFGVIWLSIYIAERDKRDADNIDQENQRVSRILKAVEDVRKLDHDREERSQN